MNRCDSGTDSTVWMEEDVFSLVLCPSILIFTLRIGRVFFMGNEQDRQYMQRAISLAKAGEGWCHPNPMVGAVIVKDGRIIGEGFHQRSGQLHAERNAIANAKAKAGESAADLLTGAAIYVTLEPCCHYGKTPPCTEAIIESRIGRVVIGSRDPNPLVAGKGAKILREAGIEVEEDFLREECDAINPVFFHYIETKTPYVIMKYAMTADGKIATKTGASQWITGQQSLQEVHRLRHACMGIMAGIGTVLADDPTLNCRWEGAEEPALGGSEPAAGSALAVAETALAAAGPVPTSADLFGLRHPVRIICDSRLQIPLDSRICRTAGEYETIVVCASAQLPTGELKMEQLTGSVAGQNQQEIPMREVPAQEGLQEAAWQQDVQQMTWQKDPEAAPRQLTEKIRNLIRMGVTVLNVPGQTGSPGAGRVNLKELMRILGARGIDSILLEGGGTLNESALRAGIVSEVRAFIAPKFFGGAAKSPVEGSGVELPDEAFRLELLETKQFGEDLMLRYRVEDAINGN